VGCRNARQATACGHSLHGDRAVDVLDRVTKAASAPGAVADAASRANQYLNILAEEGLIGVVAFALLAIGAVAAARRASKAADPVTFASGSAPGS
jgi:hypothetical protein